MDIKTNQSEAVQMEASVYQEDQVIKSKDTEAHTIEGETQLDQQGQDDTQNTKGNICNGESWFCLDGIQISLSYAVMCAESADSMCYWKECLQ